MAWAAVIAAAVVLAATVAWMLPGSLFVASSSDIVSNEQQTDEQRADAIDENTPTDQAVVGESKTDSTEVQPAATSGGSDTPTVSEPYEQGVVLLSVDPGATAEDVAQKLANAEGVTTADVSDQDLPEALCVNTAEGVFVEDAVTADEAGLSSQPNFCLYHCR